ncbi:MAG: AAA family ATPase [Rhodospirillaceae bacterium]|nr:AAA family ATPase [Rhodospirillaceae bacterium]
MSEETRPLTPGNGEAAQTAAIDFLASPATHGGAAVERISTHGAHVFMAGDRAYKLKRAVKLPFMDFSTIERRRAALEAELDLNRRTAPTLYIEVRAIRRGADGRPGFAGPGDVLDWVLVMRRFEQAALLDAVAVRGELTAAIIDDLADVVAAMHAAAPIVRRAEGAYFSATALDNLAPLRAAPIDQAAVERLAVAIAGACRSASAHLDARARAGFVRHCHGDLHLRNIVMLDGQPVPFDALEFDAGLATGDVYYDLAFLLMDLEHRGLRPLAHRLFNRYVTGADDLEGLLALPVFLAVRAAVRAKVAALSAAPAEAAGYVALANGYLPAPKPRLIAVGGLSGTGKSSVAMRLAPSLAPAPGAVVLRSDVHRKRLFGIPDTARLPPEAYTPEAGARVYGELARLARRVLAAGHGVVVDAVFAKPDERAMVEHVARGIGVPFLGLWLEAPLAVRESRVGIRVRDASDADAAVARAQERYDIGALAWSRIDAGGALDEVCARVVAAAAS